ncbi:glycosyltransferase family 4 protein [Candidatus Daviesbacteria bacterium]|nr:glycosyltransferase family 4 protein [Candidatus Daviesbacteria bacterium]
MKIAVDARFFNESGVGRYVRNLISNLAALDKKNQYYILLLKKDYDKFKETKNFTKVLADFRWYGFAEQFKLPKLLKELKLDLVHFPHFNVPIFYTGKFVVTIHDLIHQHRHTIRATRLDPFTSKIKQIGYRKVFKVATNKSQKILVPSKSVKQLLLDEWGIDKERIVVTPEAVDSSVLEIANEISKVDCEKVLSKFKIKQPYLFYVGNAHPHKNVEGLIGAFKELRQKYKSLSLVLSGYDHYFWQRVKKENPYEGIIYTGFVTDEEMVALYKEAETFVMPSFEEGFGIPVLEAMACTCPVVASSAGSLPEVGEEAALYFDPAKPDDMAEKISLVLGSEKLRQKLIEKGLKRYKQFSWRKLAEKTLEVYQKCG